MTDEDRKTWQDWNDLLDAGIVDPDGFRGRTNSYTIQEFVARLPECTLVIKPRLTVESLAKAMAKEFPFLRASDQDWIKAAQSIINKMREEQQQ